MTARELRRVLRGGDLAAITLNPGAAWLPVLRHAREVGAAILPIDVRLSKPERAALIATAHPTVIADDAGCDPKMAVEVANELARQGVVFVDGHYCSGASIPASRSRDRMLARPAWSETRMWR